ncbi:MAG: hypothetical protein QXE12_01975 [Conexivisphaerales archaeon]
MRTKLWMLAAAGLLIALRLIPVFQGGPVFSIDAWPLLANSNLLLHAGHAEFFPCQQQPSCYFASWPSLEVLSVQLSSVTGIPLLYVPLVVVSASTALQFFAVLLLCKLFVGKYWPGALFLLADAPANLFYSGFKQEMYAMSIAVLAIFIVAKKMQNLSGKDLVAFSIAGLGVVFGHHYSTYILAAAVTGPIVYSLLRVETNGKSSYRLAGVILLTLMAAYYVTQFSYISAVSGYNLSFIITLLSYDTVLGMLAFRLLNSNRQVGFPRFFAAFALAGIVFTPFLGKFLYVPLDSASIISQIVFLLPLLPVASLGLASIISADRERGSIILFWFVAPLAVSIFAIFDGNAVLAYRGYVAATIPSAVAFSAALSWMAGSRSKSNSIKVYTLIFLFAVSVTAGVYSEVLPVYSARDIFDGSTWFYPTSQLTAVSDASRLVQQNTTIFTDLPTLSYFFMLQNRSVTAALPQSFAGEEKSGVLLLQQSDDNEFYFTGNYASLTVNLSSLARSNTLFRGAGYSIYASG